MSPKRPQTACLLHHTKLTEKEKVPEILEIELRADIHRKRGEKKSRGCGPYRDNEFERNVNMFKLGIHRKKT